MITQIYGITTPEDAAAVADLGADRIGVVVCEDESITPDGTTFDEARDIMRVIPPHVTTTVLHFSSDVDELEEVVRTLDVKVLHLSSLEAMPLSAVKKLLGRVPELKVMQAIPVGGEEAIERGKEFSEVVESLILDTLFEGVKIGATGLTHDWSISRKIVEQCDVPVILAGGLSPENVAEAIRQVGPWGVDSFTLTSNPDDLRRKDLKRVREFIEAATGAV